MIYLRIYALSALGSTAVSAICIALNYPRIAVLPMVLSFVLALAYVDKAMKLQTQSRERGNPNDWMYWLKMACPRHTLLKDNSKLARNALMLFFGVASANEIIVVFLMSEVHSPALRFSGWVSSLLILGGLICSAELWRLARKANRLVANGAITIGTVTALRTNGPRRTVAYQFIDDSGDVIVGAGPDASGFFEVGSSIPVFYNPEKPKDDQIALCRSPYTVTASVPYGDKNEKNSAN